MIKIIYRSHFLIFIFLLTLSFLQPAISQMSEGGIPLSKQNTVLKAAVDIPAYTTKQISIEDLLAEDEIYPTPARYSVFEDVSIDLKKEGIITEIPDHEGSIWRYSIRSQEAKSLQVYFKDYFVPEGAKIFLYNKDYSEILGAFTERNNHLEQSLMIADFPGNELIIEYFEPSNAAFEGSIVIGSLGIAYKNFEKSSFNEDEGGFINVNCSEGREWQDEKHAVARFTFRVGTSGFTCSGALINNVAIDGTPYFLTANHCLDSESAANTVVAYFNYEFYGCGGQLNDGSTLSGAKLLATAAESDYTLLLFNTTPTADYLPYYAGWDASGDSGTIAVGIHHPSSNPKKISIDDSSAKNHPFNIGWQGGSNTPPDSHWRVEFDKGTTAGGSSGSPLFNEHGRILGQLHGGSSTIDYYGKINYSWTTESETGRTLQSYLDPDNSGIRVLDGYYPSENEPDPQISTDFTQLCDSAAVTLYGLSAFDPIAWEWSFLPDDVTFLDSTNAQSENPIIEFNQFGDYTINLEVTNAAGTSSRAFSNAVSVGSSIEVEVITSALTDNCLAEFDSLVLVANGANDYTWSLSESSSDFFTIVNDTLNTALIKANGALLSSTDFDVFVTGKHGRCEAEAVYSQSLIAQSNDMAADAIEIFVGTSEEFSNECASIQEGEPIPPFESCTGQNSWCDEYGTGEDIVENSVWFYFIAPDSSDYRISSTGMDNQIAVYDVGSLEELLAGDTKSTWANDDFTAKDANPRINRMSLIQGKKYWVQVDGSAGGAEGSFVFEIEKLEPVGIPEEENSFGSINLYPQPADDRVLLEWDRFMEIDDLSLQVYSANGRLIYKKKYLGPTENQLEIDVQDWQKGIYFIHMQGAGFSRTLQMVK